MNEDCEDCVYAAKANPPSDAASYLAGCRSCQARMVAGIGAEKESAEVGYITAQYAEVLEALFGDDWKDGHELVKEWASRIKQGGNSIDHSSAAT